MSNDKQPHAGAEREAQLIQMAKDLIVTLETPHEPSWKPQNTVALALVTAYCAGKGDAEAANAELKADRDLLSGIVSILACTCSDRGSRDCVPFHEPQCAYSYLPGRMDAAFMQSMVLVLKKLDERSKKPGPDADHENDQLWLALANYACNCTTPEEKQVEVHVEMAGHKNYCAYRALRAEIKGDDAK